MTQIADHIRRITSGPEHGRLHPEIDPATTRALADDAAHALRDLDLDLGAIACWTSPENLVLTFAVAETLGLPSVHLAEDQGLLYLSWELPPARIALVAAAGEPVRQLEIAATMLAGSGHTCVAVAEMTVATGDHEGSLTVRALDQP